LFSQGRIVVRRERKSSKRSGRMGHGSYSIGHLVTLNANMSRDPLKVNNPVRGGGESMKDVVYGVEEIVKRFGKVMRKNMKGRERVRKDDNRLRREIVADKEEGLVDGK
jgi:hypothetical protein